MTQVLLDRIKAQIAQFRADIDTVLRCREAEEADVVFMVTTLLVQVCCVVLCCVVVLSWVGA
jgi:CHASE3 domain sensor protein